MKYTFWKIKVKWSSDQVLSFIIIITIKVASIKWYKKINEIIFEQINSNNKVSKLYLQMACP